MGRVEYNKELKRSGIMEAAFNLFTDRGVAKTSVSDITRDSGVAKGTFYLYFKDKYDLQEHLIIQQSEMLFKHALRKSGYEKKQGQAAKIIAITDDILSQLNGNRLLLRFINKNLSWGVFRQAISKSETDYMAVFREIMGTGPEHDHDMQIYIYMVLELIGSTCVSVILENDPVSLDEYLPYLHSSIEALIYSFRETCSHSELPARNEL